MKHANCLECGGKCCHFFGLSAPKSGNKDYERYLELHGVRIVDSVRFGRISIMPLKCRNLTPEGRCGDYENRPQVCRDFDERTLDRFLVPRGCKYDITGEYGEDYQI